MGFFSGQIKNLQDRKNKALAESLGYDWESDKREFYRDQAMAISKGRVKAQEQKRKEYLKNLEMAQFQKANKPKSSFWDQLDRALGVPPKKKPNTVRKSRPKKRKAKPKTSFENFF